MPGNLTVNLWQDFDFSSLTTENLASNDHAADGTWTISNAAARLSMATAGERAFSGTVNGGDDTSGSHGLVYQSPNQYEAGFVQYQFATGPTNVSAGFWFRFPAAFVGSFAGGEPDVLFIGNLLGVYQPYIKLLDNNQARIVLFTSEAGGSTGVNLQPDTWYWITALYQASGTHRLRVYGTDALLVGAEQTRPAAANFAASRIVLGNFVGDPSQINPPFYFDDLIADWSTAAFPLGPPIPFTLQRIYQPGAEARTLEVS